MKKSVIKITTADCSGLYAIAWIDENKLEQAKAAFADWNEPNSYFKAERFEKSLFRLRYIKTICIMEHDKNGILGL